MFWKILTTILNPKVGGFIVATVSGLANSRDDKDRDAGDILESVQTLTDAIGSFEQMVQSGMVKVDRSGAISIVGLKTTMTRELAKLTKTANSVSEKKFDVAKFLEEAGRLAKERADEVEQLLKQAGEEPADPSPETEMKMVGGGLAAAGEALPARGEV
ncbi:MAG: hypothetical protein KDC27_11810 [Acidobacteria bacterium]|nr:hypothetical protein [Acidobacteriota bacterium]